jgi:hypothetical protein
MLPILQCVGLGEPVTEFACGLDGRGVAGDGIGPGTVDAEQTGKPGSEGDDTGLVAGAADVVEAIEQVGPLCPEPGQRLDLVVQGRHGGR